MAIKKPVSLADKFISAAPDASAKPGTMAEPETKGVMRGNKRQISLTLTPELLPQIDAAADALGISRAAWVSMTISQALKKQ
jgi:hypothetical protein